MILNIPSDNQVMWAFREFNSDGTGWHEAHAAAQREEEFKEWFNNLKQEAIREGYLEGRQVILNRIEEERELLRAEGALVAANEICLQLQEKISQTPVFDKRDSGVQSGLDTALKIASGVAQTNLDKIPEINPSKHLEGVEPA
jgi:hypothetical protein